MVSLLAALALGIPKPLLWLRPDGAIVSPSKVEARLLPGTKTVSTQHGIGFDFDGVSSAIEFGDAPAFRLTKSISVSTWIYLRSYVGMNNNSPGSQIVLRGDDRVGLDPYHFTVMADGQVAFSVENERGVGAFTRCPVPLHTWTHLLGSFDDRSGDLKIWVDGRLTASTTTTIRPFKRLDPASGPGFGIGNVQAPERGYHSQPLNGILSDLRLYDCVVTPVDLGITATPTSRTQPMICG